MFVPHASVRMTSRSGHADLPHPSFLPVSQRFTNTMLNRQSKNPNEMFVLLFCAVFVVFCASVVKKKKSCLNKQ